MPMAMGSATPWCRAARRERPPLSRRPGLPLGSADRRRHRLRRLAEGRVRSLRRPGGPFGNAVTWRARRAAIRHGQWPRPMPGAQRPAGVARPSAGRARSSMSGTGRRTRGPAAPRPGASRSTSAAGRGSGRRTWRFRGWVRADPTADPARARVLDNDGGAAKRLVPTTPRDAARRAGRPAG